MKRGNRSVRGAQIFYLPHVASCPPQVATENTKTLVIYLVRIINRNNGLLLMIPRFIGRRKTMRQQCHSSIIMLRASRAYVPYLPWYIGTSYRKQFGHIPGYSMLHTNSSKAAGPTTSPLCVADAVHIRDVLSYFRYLSSPKLRAEITAVRATASAGCCLLCAARLRTQQ